MVLRHRLIRGSVCDSEAMREVFTEHDVAAFDAAWRSRWPMLAPIGHHLRYFGEYTWVRFHSLPGSKRYAADTDTYAEYDEIVRRHRTLMSELCALTATSTEELLVVTGSWSDTPQPVERDSVLVATVREAVYWKSVPYDLSIPEEPVWLHLYLTPILLESNDLRKLVVCVADDRTGDVIICPPNAVWVYHPYDGGADVIAPDTATRDTLRAAHENWLPDQLHGV